MRQQLRAGSRVMLLCLAGLGCTAGHLKFTRTADGTTVASTQTLNGSVYVPSDLDLDGGRSTCVDELTAEFQGVPQAITKITPAPSAELNLYVREPNEMVSFLSGLSDGDIRNGIAALSPNQISGGIWNARTAVPAAFPLTQVLVSPDASNNAVSTAKLSSNAFWGPSFAPGLPADLILCHPKGDLTTLQPGGTFKKAVIYNRGACRVDTPLAPLLAGGNDQLVNALHTKRQLGIGNVTVAYSILQSALQLAPSAIEDPTESIFLFVHFKPHDLAGNAESDVFGAVRYDFTIQPGTGRILLTPNKLRWDYSGIWGPLSSNGALGQEGWEHAMTQPDGGFVTQANSTILGNQLLGVNNQLFGVILTNGKFNCDDNTFAQQCAVAAGEVAKIVGPQLRGKTDTQGARIFSDPDVSHMLCALGDAASCNQIGTDPAQALKNRWICTTSSISSEQRYCDLIVPVTRIVAEPDALGTVLFIRDDVDNAAYALQAASGSVCADPQKQPPPATRPFASSFKRD